MDMNRVLYPVCFGFFEEAFYFIGDFLGVGKVETVTAGGKDNKVGSGDNTG